MAHFVVKESSIKEDANNKTLDIIRVELLKFIQELNFNMTIRQGNYAFWESNFFTIENFQMGMDYAKLQAYLDNTLNFRYENFNIKYIM